MEAFVGKYKMISSENFDEYMKSLGVGLVSRKMANSVSPALEFIVSADGECVMKTITTIRSTEIKFKVGEEFEETTFDGRKCKSVVVVEGGNTLVHTQRCDGKEYKITRELSGNQLTTKLFGENVVCTRVYERS